MTLSNGRPGRLKLVLGLIVAVGAACGGGSSDPGPAKGRQLSTYHSDPGGAILLKDRTGASIPVGSATPYSPERTCGGCHDVAAITQGYHFQQGSQVVADNFNPARPWLLSDGMFGKW